MIDEHKSIAYKGKVVFHKLKSTAPERELKPFQKNEACFIFVDQGDFTVRTPDQFVDFKKGQGLLAKCFNFFFETSAKQREQGKVVNLIGVLLFPDHVEDLLKINLSDSNHNVDYNVKRVQIDKLLATYKESINVLLDNPELADESMIETKIKEFVLLLAKSMNTSPTDFLASMFKLNKTKFKTTIENNIYSTLSVSQMAELCAMSLSSFKRKFNEEYGESPKKYIARRKLEKASKMLTSSSERISDIAYDCGFDTISTFNRSFKMSFGVSPTEYRLNQTA